MYIHSTWALSIHLHVMHYVLSVGRRQMVPSMTTFSIDNFSLHVNFWNRADALVPQRQVFKTTQGNSDLTFKPSWGHRNSPQPFPIIFGPFSLILKTDVEEDIHSHCSPTTYVTNRQRYRALSKEETNCYYTEHNLLLQEQYFQTRVANTNPWSFPPPPIAPTRGQCSDWSR